MIKEMKNDQYLAKDTTYKIFLNLIGTRYFKRIGFSVGATRRSLALRLHKQKQKIHFFFIEEK